MIRPQVACLAMCRLANSLIIRAVPIASTANCRVQVAAVTGWIDRPSRSVVAAAKVSARHPVALLTRMSTGPNCSSVVSNSFLGVAGSTGRLLRRLPRHRRPGCGRRPRRRPGPGGRGIPAGYRDHPDHRPATCIGTRTRAGPGLGCRHADAVVGARDDRCVPGLHYASSSRRAMYTNSRPGRSGASRISSTVRPAAASEPVSSPRLRNRNVEPEVSIAPSRPNTKLVRKETRLP